jgi:hypothetical protein
VSASGVKPSVRVDGECSSLLRSDDSSIIALTAETPDPRPSPKTKFLPATDVGLHQVVGVFFNHGIVVGPGKEEAVLIDDSDLLERVEIAFRIVDDSAVPLEPVCF